MDRCASHRLRLPQGFSLLMMCASLVAMDLGTAVARELCGVGGNRADCQPIPNAKVALFISELGITQDRCFLTATNYSTGFGRCNFLKRYGNGIITFSSGGLYQPADNIFYESDGRGGTGFAHSQGDRGEDFFALRARSTFQGYDWYELKDGRQTFGYYDCARIVQGGAVTDFSNNYECSQGVNLYHGCLKECEQQMRNYTDFNYTSVLFGDPADTTTSQVFF